MFGINRILPSSARNASFLAGVVLAVSAVVAGDSLAQSTPLNRDRGRGGSGVRSQPAKPSKPTPPRSTGGLGGVKSKAPRPFGSIKGTLLPPVPPSDQPTFTPGSILDRAPRNARPGIGRGFVPDRRDDRNDRDDRDFRGRTGSRVDGSFDDDRFRLRFGLGSPYLPYHYRGGVYTGFGYRPLYGYYGYPHAYGNYYDYDDTPGYVQGYRYPSTLDPYVNPQQPAPQPAAPARQLTPLEQADLALQYGLSKDAVQLYRDYLRKSPEDAAATRSLALALILEKDIKEAVAVMQMVYEKQPSLASQPIPADSVPDAERGLRKMLLAVVPLANRTKSASGYLTVAVIMQAEGRHDHALRLLRKADNAGLDAKVVKELETAMQP